MKQELYYYAISLKNQKSSQMPTVCVWILLIIFLVPLILSSVVLGMCLFSAYLFCYLCLKKEIDQYNRELLNTGIFVLFLGIEFSALVLLQYRIIISLLSVILAFLVSYEILFFVKVKKKMYSSVKKNKHHWIHIVPVMLGGTGIWLGKLIANSENTDLKIWIVILLCSALITYSFSFIQRFFVHKLLGNTH